VKQLTSRAVRTSNLTNLHKLCSEDDRPETPRLRSGLALIAIVRCYSLYLTRKYICIGSAGLFFIKIPSDYIRHSIYQSMSFISRSLSFYQFPSPPFSCLLVFFLHMFHISHHSSPFSSSIVPPPVSWLQTYKFILSDSSTSISKWVSAISCSFPLSV
jgi:hypothetical protein